ncbi:MAG: hypothetical protein LC105_06690 [Chitinophagales bacterium]|nr:hypothetical protein [Chitinophagales bacterium]MCZ2393523.1 hypothetical protein [Chitinophagales bacterium]
MNLFVIILLIVSGTVLVILEIFILPGMIAGIVGGCLSIWGVYEAFVLYGYNWGWTALIVAILLNFTAIWLAFKNIHRSKLTMKADIDGRMNEFDDFGLVKGDIGTTISDLRPEGKAIFGDKMLSVWSYEGVFISSNTRIQIVKISDNKIFVEQN